MQKIKAVVFDVDGVLVDSRQANIAFFQRLMQNAGYKRPTKSAVLACYHLTLWQTLEKLTGSKNQAEIKRIWDSAFDTSLHTAHLFKFPPRLKNTLEELQKRYRLGVVTGRIRIGLELVFASSEIGHYFDVVVTYEDYQNPKPHPEPLLLASSLLKIKPDETIYVGDSPIDVEAARAAGMRSIRICPQLDEKADGSIKSFSGLVNAVQQLA